MIPVGRLAFAVASVVLVASPAWAESPRPENEDSRYSFYRAEGGFLRLDGRSGGEVSICTRRPSGWLCQTLPEERAAFEAEITRLQGDNAALKKELLAHHLAPPAGIRLDPARAPEGRPWLQRPDRQEVDRVMSVIGNVWRRLVAMVESVQRDLLKKS